MPPVTQPEFAFQPPARVWQEVPQAVFLSWSDARQRSYCAARDADSAAQATGAERQFYLDRQAAYERGF